MEKSLFLVLNGRVLEIRSLYSIIDIMINYRCEWAGKFVAGAIRGDFGAFKVGEVELDLPNEADRKMWSVDITPEMKESVMEGQVMFSIGVDKEEQAKYESMSSKDIDEYAAGKDKANITLSNSRRNNNGYRAIFGSAQFAAICPTAIIY